VGIAAPVPGGLPPGTPRMLVRHSSALPVYREGAIVAAATQWDQGDANRSIAPGTGPDASPDGSPGAAAGAAVRLDPLPLATQGPDDVLDVLALVVHRLFGIGLEVQSAAGVVGGPASDRLQLVVNELDELIRDARSMAFERLRKLRAPELSRDLRRDFRHLRRRLTDAQAPGTPADQAGHPGHHARLTGGEGPRGVRSPRVLSRTGLAAGSGWTAGAGT
jgi:hypothetical protein